MKALGKIAFRVLGIYFIVLGLSAIPATIGTFMSIVNDDFYQSYYIILILGQPLIYIIAGVLLWVLSEKLINSTITEDQIVPFSNTCMVTLTLIVLGVIIVISTTPTLVSSIVKYNDLAGFQNQYDIKAIIIENSIKLGFGIVLIVLSKQLTVLVNKFLLANKKDE